MDGADFGGMAARRRAPVDLVVASEGLAALAALLNCADEARFSSLARPQAAGLGKLLTVLHRSLEDGLAELGGNF